MGIAQVTQLIRKTGELAIDGLAVNVIIVDARYRFGTLDFRVTPLSGKGKKWVIADRVQITGYVDPADAPD